MLDISMGLHSKALWLDFDPTWGAPRQAGDHDRLVIKSSCSHPA